MNAYVYAKRMEVSRALWLGALILPMGCSPAEVDPVQLASGGAGGAGGAGASCGDGTCAADETAQSCPADCGGSGGGGGAGGGSAYGGSGGAGGAQADETWWGVTFGVTPDSWFAIFRSYWQSDPEVRGYVREIGDYCTLYDSRESVYGDTPLAGPSPGPVTLAGGAGEDVVLEPNAEGRDFLSGTSLQWEAGDAVEVSAPGQELPAFDVDSLVPEPVAGVLPDIEGAEDDEITVDLSQGFEVSWTPTDQIVDFELWQSGPGDNAGTNSVILACYFPGADGAGVLPVEGLAEFEAEPSLLVTGLGVGHVHWVEQELEGRRFIAPGFNWVSREVITQ